jgi:chemotaxis protein MotB
MIRLLITSYELSPGRLSAAGYGEFHPSASNSTSEGRAQNRRLDIVILAPTRSEELIPDSSNAVQNAPPSVPSGRGAPKALPGP